MQIGPSGVSQFFTGIATSPVLVGAQRCSQSGCGWTPSSSCKWSSPADLRTLSFALPQFKAFTFALEMCKKSRRITDCISGCAKWQQVWQEDWSWSEIPRTPTCQWSYPWLRIKINITWEAPKWTICLLHIMMILSGSDCPMGQGMTVKKVTVYSF